MEEEEEEEKEENVSLRCYLENIYLVNDLECKEVPDYKGTHNTTRHN